MNRRPHCSCYAPLLIVLLLLPAAASVTTTVAKADVVGVLDSEHNRQRYPNCNQVRLMERLGELQMKYRVIRDAEVQDSERLARVAAIATAHTYCVSQEVGDALARYVGEGGRLLWVDGPVFPESDEFCKLLGIAPGRKQACHYGRGFLTRCLQPNSPLAALDAPAKIESFVGTAFMPEGIDPAAVVYEASGEARLAGQTWEDKRARTVPAVVARKTGKGEALLLNWMALRNNEPEVRAWVNRLIGAFLPESVKNQDYRLSASLPERSYFTQPEPVTCQIEYQPLQALAEKGLQVRMVLSDGGGEEVAVAEYEWPAGEAQGRELSVPAEGVADGVYSLRLRSAIENDDWAACLLRVRLAGDAHVAELRWREEHPDDWARAQRVNERLRGFVGNYAVMPRRDDEEHSVDIPKLIEYCKQAHLDTFDWTLSRRWEDFLEFLPVADEAGIQVWATLSSPSSMKYYHHGGYGPHFLDYVAWGKELAQLSLEHPSLVAWVIDDFDGGFDIFTPDYVSKMVRAQRAISPELAFLPVIYTETIGRMPDWMTTYGRYTDGIMWPYRPLDQTDDLPAELADARAFVGPNRGLHINVYCTSTSWHKAAPTGEYVSSAMRIARELTDGMRLYCLPWSQDNERYQAAVALTEHWADRP